MHFDVIAIAKSSSRFGLVLVGLGGVGASALVSGHRPPIHYSAIKPVIEAKCMPCHNDTRHPAGVNASSWENLMKSGKHRPIIVPGRPERSALLKYIDGEKQPRMPFKQPALSKREIEAVRAWIKAGAKQ